MRIFLDWSNSKIDYSNLLVTKDLICYFLVIIDHRQIFVVGLKNFSNILFTKIISPIYCDRVSALNYLMIS